MEISKIGYYCYEHKTMVSAEEREEHEKLPHEPWEPQIKPGFHYNA